MDIARIIPSQVGAAFTVLAGLGLAVFLGLKVGMGETATVFKVVVLLAVAVYVLFFTKYTVYLALLISFLDLQWYPGFFVGSHEQSGILFAILAGTAWWMKRKETTVGQVLEGYSIFKSFLILLLVYLASHLYLNYNDSIILEGYSVKGSLKQYYRYTISFIAIAYFFGKSSGQFLGSRPSATAARMVFVCLAFNIVVRIWKNRTEGENPIDVGDASFLIPFLHITDNVFALRTLAPFSATIAAALMTSNAPGRPSPLFCKVIFGLSCLGAVLSGGRAALLFCIFLASVIFIIRRRTRPVFILGCIFILVAAMVNIFPDTYVRPLPWALKRSLAKLVVVQDLEEEAGIKGSTDFRKRIFFVALDFWRNGGPRLLWTGQGASSFNETDSTLLQGVETAQSDQTALRLGGTHNLITDLLVMLGLIGFLLYYLIGFALIHFLWRWYRRCSVDWETKDWTLVSCLLVIFYYIYASFGGSPFWISIAWIIVLTSMIYRREAQLGLAQKSLGPPPVSRPFESRMARGS